MPQILHRRIEKLIVPEPEILMLRPSVLLAQRIAPHAVPTALTIISLILRAQTGNNRLQEHGITVDAEKLDALIEAAVYDLTNNGLIAIEQGVVVGEDDGHEAG